MNANPSNFVFNNRDGLFVINRNTGEIQSIKYIQKLERTPDDVMDVYAGHYPHYEFCIVFETADGEQFAYPFSYGYASPEYIQEIVDAVAQPSSIETESSFVAGVIAPRGNGLEYFNRLAERETLRKQNEYCDRAKKRIGSIIERVERGFAEYNQIHEDCMTSIFIAFPQQLNKLWDIIERHNHGGEVYDYQHKMNDKPQTLLPSLRALLDEFIPENLTNVGKNYPELPAIS